MSQTSLVVLDDVAPPYATSLTQFRETRADVFPHLPVILTTTHGQCLADWLGAGEVENVFLKPCELRALAGAIRQAARLRSCAR